MRKMILTLAIMIASIGMSFANEMKVDSLLDVAKVELKKDSVKPSIVSLYDVERIKIQNPAKKEINIYDCYWNLILSCNDSVDMAVTPGNYYISSKGVKLRGKYIAE